MQFTQWQDPQERQRRQDGAERRDADRLLGTALALAASLFFASTLPPALLWPLLSVLWHAVALGLALHAAINGDVVWAPQVTRWDQAAIFLAAAQLAELVGRLLLTQPATVAG